MSRTPHTCLTVGGHKQKNSSRRRCQYLKRCKSTYEYKALYGNVYTNTPIFRRKLIEKYSTARYNLNTKFVLKRNSRIRKHGKLRKKYGQSGGDDDDGDNEDDDGGDNYNDDEYNCNYEFQKTERSTEVKKNDSHEPKKASLVAEEETFLNRAQKCFPKIWKIVSNDVYYYLREKYERKSDPQLKKKKKRKRKGYRKKVGSACVKQKIFTQDPYIDCLDDLKNVREPRREKQEDQLGIVMYVGVGRPLFPLIYRNIRLLNGDKETLITDFWAEFALSTLIAKPDDETCKPVLVSVKDPELRSLVDRCGERNADDQIEIKLENRYENGAKETQNWIKNRHPIYTHFKFDDMRLTNKKIDRPSENKNHGAAFDGNSDERKILKEFGYKECFVAVPKLDKAQIRALSVDNVSKASGCDNFDRIEEEEEEEGNQEKCNRDVSETNVYSVLSQQKENDDELHYFGSCCTRTYGMMTDYVLRNRTTVYHYKLRKMLDFQKTNNKYFTCCDYLSIERVEMNNSIDISHAPTVTTGTSENDTDILVRECASSLSSVYIGIDNADRHHHHHHHHHQHQHVARCKRSKNPNDILKYLRISEWKDGLTHFTSVKMHHFRSTTKTTRLKWLSLKLDKSIVSVCYAESRTLRHRLLFEILYRAELSKKVICCPIEKIVNLDPFVKFGVYSFPGICDVVFVGPYLFHDQHQLTASVRSSDGCVIRAIVNTSQEKENFPRQDGIEAEWWWPGKLLDSNNVNERYLQFLFNPRPIDSRSQIEKLNLETILREHSCWNFHSYQIAGREHNFVLFHDLTNTLRNVEQCDSAAAGAMVGNNVRNQVAESKTNNSRIIRKRNFDHFNYRKRCDAKKNASQRKHPMKNDAFRNTLRSRNRRYTVDHIENERKRRLEFRNFKNHLESILTDKTANKSPSVISLNRILQKSIETIKWLEMDTLRLANEAKSLRKKQMKLTKFYSTILKSFDSETLIFKKGVKFIAYFKEIKELSKKKYLQLLHGEDFLSKINFPAALNDIDQETVYPDFFKILQNNSKLLNTQKKKFTSSKDSKTNMKSSIRHCQIKEKRKLGLKRSRRRKTFHDSITSSQPTTKICLENVVKKFNYDFPSKRRLSNPTFSSGEVLERDPLGNDPVHNLNQNEEAVIRKPRSYIDVDTSNVSSNSNMEKKSSTYTPYLDHSYCDMNYRISSSSDIIKIGEVASRQHFVYGKDDAMKSKEFASLSGRSQINRKLTQTKVNNSAIRVPKSYYSERGEEKSSVNNAKTTTQAANFQVFIREKSCEQFCIDVTENRRVFARLNIAKIRDANRNESPSTSASDNNGKMLTVIQKILSRIQPSMEVNNCTGQPRPSTSAKKALFVSKLRSLIEHMKFENTSNILCTRENTAIKRGIPESECVKNVATEEATSVGWVENEIEEDGDGDGDGVGVSRISRRRDFEISDIENVILEEEIEQAPYCSNTESNEVSNENFVSVEEYAESSPSNVDSLANVSPIERNSTEIRTSAPTPVEAFGENENENMFVGPFSDGERCQQVDRAVEIAETVDDEEFTLLNSLVGHELKTDVFYKKYDSNRICVKPFACAGNFDQVFPSNVDKLLHPS